MTKLVAAAILALTVGVSAQEHGQYRDFQLGASLAAVSALAGMPASDATLIHERPARMQELRWIPSYSATAPPVLARGAALQQIVFSFYEDQLSRLMVDYDRFRTKGMTDDDMIRSISALYGPPVPTTASRAIDSNGESMAPRRVAQWVAPDYTVTLSRWAFGAALRLTVESTRLTELARTADARALVLDARDGPQRDAARLKEQEANRREELERTRTTNKATFQP